MKLLCVLILNPLVWKEQAATHRHFSYFECEVKAIRISDGGSNRFIPSSGVFGAQSSPHRCQLQETGYSVLFYLFPLLNFSLKPLSEYSREYKQIKKYIENGYDPLKLGYTIQLQSLFAVVRPGEREEFDDFRFCSKVRN